MLNKLYYLIHNFILRKYPRWFIPHEYHNITDNYELFTTFWSWSIWLAITNLIGLVGIVFGVIGYIKSGHDWFYSGIFVLGIFYGVVIPLIAKKQRTTEHVIIIQLVALTTFLCFRLFKLGHINEGVLIAIFLIPSLGITFKANKTTLICSFLFISTLSFITFNPQFFAIENQIKIDMDTRHLGFVLPYTAVYFALCLTRLKRFYLTKQLKSLFLNLMQEKKYVQIFEIQKSEQAIITSLNHDLNNPITILQYTLPKVQLEDKSEIANATRHLDSINMLIKKFTDKQDENMGNKKIELDNKFNDNNKRYEDILKNFEDTLPFENESFFIFIIIMASLVLTNYIYDDFVVNPFNLIIFAIASITLTINALRFKIPHISSLVFASTSMTIIYNICTDSLGIYSPFLNIFLILSFLFIMVDRLQLIILSYCSSIFVLYKLHQTSTPISLSYLNETNKLTLICIIPLFIIFIMSSFWRENKSQRFFENFFKFKNFIDSKSDYNHKLEKIEAFKMIQQDICDSLTDHFNEAETSIQKNIEFYKPEDVLKIRKALTRMGLTLKKINEITSEIQVKKYANGIEMLKF